jgi:hypothetical protein
MLADMQRARILAEELPAVGWAVEVLTPGLAYQRSLWIEPDAGALRPQDAIVHEAKLRFDGFFRAMRMRSVGWRALGPLYFLGANLLATKRFDLVYISTTQFVLFCLGPLWYRRFGVPYVLDFQDPWYHEEERHVTSSSQFKRKVSNWLAKTLEGLCVGSAAGIVSVSPNYLFALNQRYPRSRSATTKRQEVIPFAGESKDLSLFAVRRTSDDETRGYFRIVYVGAGGGIMAKSFSHIVECLVRLKETDPPLLDRIRVQLFGTYAYWKEGEPKPLQEIADRAAIAGMVEESPARITYLQAMKLVKEADGLIVLGVDDPAYMPSKLFTYALTGKPLLGCFHADSQAARYFERIPALGHLIRFDLEGCARIQDDMKVVRIFLRAARERERADRSQALSDYLPKPMAARHAELFERCINE